ncbi:transposase [Acetobacter pomorum DSM 11825]|nr:transposase [Acetobacter pomorum DSM 11825]
MGICSDSFRQDLLIHEILAVIPSRKGRIATRYNKTALSFMNFLNLAAARLWIKSFVNVT